MSIQIDPLSPVAIYLQIRDQVVLAIARGELHRGESLASVRSLASAFGINPATVAKAYDLLRADGLVASNAKSGTFVIRDPSTGPADAAFLDEWRQRYAVLVAEAISQGVTPAQLHAETDRVLRELNPHN